MKLEISFIHKGETNKVVTLPADIIKWERYTDQKFSDLWKNESLRIGQTDLAVFIWAVLWRKQITNQPFDIWIDDLEEISEFGEPEPANPIEAGVSSDSD